MRKVLPMSRIREMEPYMDAKVLDYIHEGQIEAFEGFEDFDLIAFDWYDVRSERTAASQMLLYLDREDLFVFCEDDAAEDAAQAALLVPEEEALSNEQVLHRFFVRLLRGDMAHLDRLEADISDGETEVLTGAHEAYLDRIIAWRQELLRLKRYYEQLDSIFDELAENDNSLLGKQNTRRFANLGNRMERYLNAVQSLRESVAQLREAYQSQLSIQQNDLMKIFTVVTAVFLPLTLLVGWYGMNFVGMPELHWKYGYTGGDSGERGDRGGAGDLLQEEKVAVTQKNSRPPPLGGGLLCASQRFRLPGPADICRCRRPAASCPP